MSLPPLPLESFQPTDCNTTEEVRAKIVRDTERLKALFDFESADRFEKSFEFAVEGFQWSPNLLLLIVIQLVESNLACTSRSTSVELSSGSSLDTDGQLKQPEEQFVPEPDEFANWSCNFAQGGYETFQLSTSYRLQIAELKWKCELRRSSVPSP